MRPPVQPGRRPELRVPGVHDQVHPRVEKWDIVLDCARKPKILPTLRIPLRMLPLLAAHQHLPVLPSPKRVEAKLKKSLIATACRNFCFSLNSNASPPFLNNATKLARIDATKTQKQKGQSDWQGWLVLGSQFTYELILSCKPQSVLLFSFIVLISISVQSLVI